LPPIPIHELAASPPLKRVPSSSSLRVRDWRNGDLTGRISSYYDLQAELRLSLNLAGNHKKARQVLKAPDGP